MAAIAIAGVLFGGKVRNANAAGSTPANWPQFRGPNSQGVAEGDAGKPQNP